MDFRTALCSANWWTNWSRDPSTRSTLSPATSKWWKTWTSKPLLFFLFQPIDQWPAFDRYCRFQEACKKYGVPELDIFQTTDLSERKDIAAVTATIFALGRTVRVSPTSKVNFFGKFINKMSSILFCCLLKDPWWFGSCVKVNSSLCTIQV